MVCTVYDMSNRQEMGRYTNTRHMTELGVLELTRVLTTPGVHSMLYVTAKLGVLTVARLLYAHKARVSACRVCDAAGTDVFVLPRQAFILRFQGAHIRSSAIVRVPVFVPLSRFRRSG